MSTTKGIIVPETLRFCMGQKGVDAPTLAKMSGVSTRTIRAKATSSNLTVTIQNGKLKSIADALGVTTAELSKPMGIASVLDGVKGLADNQLMQRIVRASVSGHGELALFLLTIGSKRSNNFPNGAGDGLIRVVDEHNHELAPQKYLGVYETGAWHRTVILLFSRTPGKLVVQYRHSDIKFAGLRDVFGGHETPGDPSSLGTAIREANSELKLSVNGTPLAWSVSQNRRLGDEYSFKIDREIPNDGGINREFSTVYLVRAPIRDCDFHYQEECENGYIVETPESQTEDCNLDKLIRLNDSYPDIFADGLGRVLGCLGRDSGLADEVRKWLAW